MNNLMFLKSFIKFSISFPWFNVFHKTSFTYPTLKLLCFYAVLIVVVSYTPYPLECHMNMETGRENTTY